jgi:hypothetical protein
MNECSAGSTKGRQVLGEDNCERDTKSIDSGELRRAGRERGVEQIKVFGGLAAQGKPYRTGDGRMPIVVWLNECSFLMMQALLATMGEKGFETQTGRLGAVPKMRPDATNLDLWCNDTAPWDEATGNLRLSATRLSSKPSQILEGKAPRPWSTSRFSEISLLSAGTRRDNSTRLRFEGLSAVCLLSSRESHLPNRKSPIEEE